MRWQSFFKSIKTELIYKNKYLNRAAADLDVFQWIEGWYNRKRRHSALAMLNMEEFECLLFNQRLAA